MRFVFYESLTDTAKRALNKGDGKHGKFAVDGEHIALLRQGRADEWIKVVRDHGPVIEGIADDIPTGDSRVDREVIQHAIPGLKRQNR